MYLYLFKCMHHLWKKPNKLVMVVASVQENWKTRVQGQKRDYHTSSRQQIRAAEENIHELEDIAIETSR